MDDTGHSSEVMSSSCIADSQKERMSQLWHGDASIMEGAERKNG